MIKEALELFDNPKDGDNKDISSVIGVIGEDLCVAAYRHYKEIQDGYKVKIRNEVPVEDRNGRSRKRLDKWVEVSGGDGHVLYQCEIKNWSSSSFGGRRLSIDHEDEETKEVGKFLWRTQLVDQFRKKDRWGVTKVILRMSPPDIEMKDIKIEPLLIYWMPLVDDSGKITPEIVVPVDKLWPEKESRPDGNWGDFDKLTVFSVSVYFRELLNNGETSIELVVPNRVENRMKLLNAIIG